MADLTLPITHIAPLVPHSGEMILLDRIIDFGTDFLIAEADICSDHVLLKHEKLAAFAGIEIMAQGVAAWAGYLAVRAGEPVRLGYLLGTRKLYIHRRTIPIGTTLRIEIKMSIQDATGFGVFDCRLIDAANNDVVLEGALNVFSPTDNRQQEKR